MSLFFQEVRGVQGEEETPGVKSAAAVECPKVPSTSAFRPHGTVVLQIQRDTTDAITVIAADLKQKGLCCATLHLY